jgi:allantoate deiminase
MPGPDSRSSRTVADWLDALARHSSGAPGVTRLAWTEPWCDAQRWLVEQARTLGLETTVDAAGNLYMHDPAVRPGDLDRPVVLTGSHLDSVVQGGRFDGALGVVAGLLIAAARRGEPGLPVVGFVCAEEEESRFRGGLLGARAALGELEASELDALRDRDGVSLRAALDYARARGCAAPLAAGARPCVPTFRPAAYVELHIEQGPVLEAESLPLAIVEHIAGARRVSARVTGEPRHAGTTPMNLRHDALAAGAAMILAIEHLANGFGAPAVATTGWAAPRPGLFNVVPGECELWIELRHADPATLAAMEGEARTRLEGIAERRGVTVAFEDVSRQDPVAMTASLVALADDLAREQGIAHRRMTSGAGHDAMRFAARGVPAVMTFVPSHRGISHSPDEYTEPEALERGVAFTRDLVGRIARERGA